MQIIREKTEYDDIQITGYIKQPLFYLQAFELLVGGIAQPFDPVKVGDSHQDSQNQGIIIEHCHYKRGGQGGQKHQRQFYRAVFGKIVDYVDDGQVTSEIK